MGQNISDLMADCIDISDNYIEFTRVTGVDCVTSTTKVEPVSSLSIFPNPATNYITVTYEDLRNQRGQLELVSITGQVLYTRMLNTVNDTIQINVSDMSSGVYLIRLSNNESVSIEKVIITK